MAQLYVYALTDSPLRTWTDGGRRIESVPVGPIFAICERRVARPVLNEEELRRQYSIVLKIAESVPAILTVRFGSLVNSEELAKTVRKRGKILAKALDRVRNAVQMTLRVPVEIHRPAPAPHYGSGRAYLQLRLQATNPEVPKRVRKLLDRLRPLILEERRGVSSSGRVTIYHLVKSADVARYRRLFTGTPPPGVLMTGPRPAFAFVPDVWP